MAERVSDKYVLLKEYELKLPNIIPESLRKYVSDFIEECVYEGYDSCSISELDISHFSRIHDIDCPIEERLELNDLWCFKYVPIKNIFTRKVKTVKEKEIQLVSRKEKRLVMFRNLSNFFETLGYKTELKLKETDNYDLYGDQKEIVKLYIYWR